MHAVHAGEEGFFIDIKQGLVLGWRWWFSLTLNTGEEAEEKDDIVTDICVLKQDIFVFHYTYIGTRGTCAQAEARVAPERGRARVRERVRERDSTERENFE